MNYYNEFDPKAAAWLRELIKNNFIPNGFVDTRSITEIKPDELKPYTQCHFFAGIGGWSHALQLARWPADQPVWTGSCPCQPFSVAGKGLGEADERHLWPVFHRLIAECRPPVVFGEQVASKDALRWLDGVFADLEGADYACGAADLCAAGVGAPHIRQRLYWVAYAESSGCKQSEQFTYESEEKNGKWTRNISGICEVFSGLGEPDGTGRKPGKPPTTHARHGCSAEPASSAGGMGDTEQSGLERFWEFGKQQIQERREGAERHCSKASFWCDFDLLPCLDGKTRRVESGTFPLAHGVSGRVGLLRGYGNAIVPQVAAQFIQAAEEARGITE